MDKSHVLGIDIGTSTIKVFSGIKTNEKALIINSIGLMPTAGFDKGVVSDYTALASSVRQAVDCVVPTERFLTPNIYLGIGGMGIRAFNTVGSIAPLSPKIILKEDIDRACRSAVLTSVSEELTVLHVLPVSYWVDKIRQKTAPIGRKGACLEVEVHIVTAPKDGINELTAAIKSKGIHISGIVANGIVCAQALIAGADKFNGIIVDIGAGTTEIIIYRDNNICYSASIPLGGNYITRDIMKALGVNEQHAESIKRYYSRLNQSLAGKAVSLDCNDYGTTDKHVSYDFLSDVIESRVNEIVFLIREYAKELIAENRLDEILFTGGCAAMPSFRASLERCFGVQARQIIPKGLSSEYAYFSNAACYGTMLYAVQNSVLIENTLSTSFWKSLQERIRRLF